MLGLLSHSVQISSHTALKAETPRCTYGNIITINKTTQSRWWTRFKSCFRNKRGEKTAQIPRGRTQWEHANCTQVRDSNPQPSCLQSSWMLTTVKTTFSKNDNKVDTWQNDAQRLMDRRLWVWILLRLTLMQTDVEMSKHTVGQVSVALITWVVRSSATCTEGCEFFF